MSFTRDPSLRTDLIDITYEFLFDLLSDKKEASVQSLIRTLNPRKTVFLDAISGRPFGSPNAESKKKVESGTFKFPDGVECKIEPFEKTHILRIASTFDIDEIQAAILFRSFLYNQGLKSYNGEDEEAIVQDMLVAILPFYHNERSFVYRCLLPLFRYQGEDDPKHFELTERFFEGFVVDSEKLVLDLLSSYETRINAPIPPSLTPLIGPKRWTQQNLRESLCLVEVLFWIMWSFATPTPSLVHNIYSTLCSTNLGEHLNEEQELYALDDEGRQIFDDMAVLWILVGMEVLELEALASENEGPEEEARLRYIKDPDELTKIHQLVMSRQRDPRFSLLSISWAFVLNRLLVLSSRSALSDAYMPFVQMITPHHHGENQLPLPATMIRSALGDNIRALRLLLGILDTSPVFKTNQTHKLDSSVTEPNAIGFRSIMKGFVIALVSFTTPETVPSIDTLFEVWISLFGRAEPASTVQITIQFWEVDYSLPPPPSLMLGYPTSRKSRQHSYASTRKVLFDYARSRFPVYVRPLVRLLRSMSASGFDLASSSSLMEVESRWGEERREASHMVFQYFHNLETYTTAIPFSAGVSWGLFELTHGVQTIRSSKPIKLPGGMILNARCNGAVLNDPGPSTDGDHGPKIPVVWRHQHSGWKVILDILTTYAYQESGLYAHRYPSSAKGARKDAKVGILDLEDVGVGLEEDPEETVVDCLDLIRSVIQDYRELAEKLVAVLDEDVTVSHVLLTSSGDADSTAVGSPPDLVQLTTMILESALRKTKGGLHGVRRGAGEDLSVRLVMASLSVLTSLLAVPSYSARVWLYLRHTSILFERPSPTGGRNPSLFSETILAKEKLLGSYPALLSLLKMIQALFTEATVTIVFPPHNEDGDAQEHDSGHQKLLEIKEEVLMRAARFVHTQVWVEYFGGWGGGGGAAGGGGGWKFLNLAERFEVGRRIARFYADVLDHSSPLLREVNGVRRAFEELSNAISDAFLYQATTTSINPLTHLIAAGQLILAKLYEARRNAEIQRLIPSLEVHLRLARLVLNIKQQSPPPISNQTALLEQALCSPINTSIGADRVEPIEVLASYIDARDVGEVVPIEASRVLSSLCVSLSQVIPTHHNIIGHLSNPENTVSRLVKIIENPYQEFTLRHAIWNFICRSMDREPALAALFISGKPSGSSLALLPSSSSTQRTAFDVARDSLENWQALWDWNPGMLASVLQFLDVCWQHALEHKTALESLRKGEEPFWDFLLSIAKIEVGPVPDYDTTGFGVVEGARHSTLHEPVSLYSYRILCKAHAIHLLGLDLGLGSAESKCFKAIDELLSSEDDLQELVSEAAASAYDPAIHDSLSEHLHRFFPGIHLEQLRLRYPLDQRRLGDHFVFSLPLLRSRLSAYEPDLFQDESVLKAEKLLMSLNLNLSLSHAQTQLSESLQLLLRQYAIRARGSDKLRSSLLLRAASISYDLGREDRMGEMMSMIHGTRLGLLLGILELMWFEPDAKKLNAKVFAELVQNVEKLFLNEAQPPTDSVLRKISAPFHRTLVLITYFLARQSTYLAVQSSLQAEHRLKISGFVEQALSFLITTLPVVFRAAIGRLDLDLDQDMEVMVATFSQCIHISITPSSTLWLAKCSETDIIRSSLDLLGTIDVSGLRDPAVLLLRKRALYAPHVVLFHMSLSRVPLAAERLANEGVILTYSNNSLTPTASAGALDLVLPELPGDRNPAHVIWTDMLSVASNVIAAVGKQNHYFDATACAFVQLYQAQIAQALSWTNDDVISLPLLEEIEQVVNIFFALALSAPRAANPHPAVSNALNVFTEHALFLLQQFNYALTHPHHLATLLEPITPLERKLFEKESSRPDLTKNTLFVKLVHAMYRVTGAILHTLASISMAEVILLRDDNEWPVCEPRVAPQLKVVVNEAASQGTLIELGNATLGTLREMTTRQLSQSLYQAPTASSSNPQLEPLTVGSGVRVARRCLETLLVYSVAQLVVSFNKPDSATINVKDSITDETDDVTMDGSVIGKDVHQRKGRKSATLAERMRRGMPAEVASELQSLLAKAKPVLAQSGEMLTGKKSSIELVDILVRFLTERTAAASST